MRAQRSNPSGTSKRESENNQRESQNNKLEGQTNKKEGDASRRQGNANKREDSSSAKTSKREEILRSQVLMLQQENVILKMKSKKVEELQQKVEIVLKQNSQLLAQNQKLSRLFQQQKTEADSLRAKNQGFQEIREDLQNQKKVLSETVNGLKERLEEAEQFKSARINQAKQQTQLSLQVYRKQFSSEEQAFKRQMRKLKEQLDKREKEISQLAAKNNKIVTDWECDAIRWKEEKETLKNQITFCQTDKLQELQTLRKKIENNFTQQLEAMRRVHASALEELEKETYRLRDKLNQAQRQQEFIQIKSTKQRTFYEETIAVFRQDIDNHRIKLLEAEQIRQIDLKDMSQKLTTLHRAQLDQTAAKHQLSLQLFRDQIQQLQKKIHGKDYEIEKIIKERAQMRHELEEQIYVLKQKKGQAEFRLKEIQVRIGIQREEHAQKLQEKKKQTAYVQNLMDQQGRINQKEVRELTALIKELSDKAQSQGEQSSRRQSKMKQEISSLKKELQNAQKENQLLKLNSQQQIKQLRSQLDGTSANLNSQTQSLGNKNSSLIKDNAALKQLVQNQTIQLKQLLQQAQQSTQRQNRLENQIEALRQNNINRQQKTSSTLAQLQTTLQQSYQSSINNIAQQHQHALDQKQLRSLDSEKRLKQKEQQLSQIVQSYKRLVEQFTVLKEQQANKKNITLKFPGANSSIMAAKSVFDVYLKAKVLKYCSPALNCLKQNANA